MEPSEIFRAIENANLCHLNLSLVQGLKTPCYEASYLTESHEAQSHAHTSGLTDWLRERQRSKRNMDRAASSRWNHLEMNNRNTKCHIWVRG